jgi:hypothetical protein
LVFTALFCFAPFSVFFSRMSAPHWSYSTGHEVAVGLSFFLIYISATRWPIYCCPLKKNESKKVALKMCNFVIHL